MARAKFNAKGKPKRTTNRVVGDVRQSQLITTYGVGSVVDFINDTIIIAGVDDWDKNDGGENFNSRKIFNPNLQSLTGAKYFLEPKIGRSDGWIKTKDIPAFAFPEMLYCPSCKKLITAKEATNANPKRPNKCCLNRQDGKACNGTLTASRFVVICENGHMEDFPYTWWVHGNAGCKSDRVPRLSMYNIRDRSDLDSLYIKCEACGKTRAMSEAFSGAAFGGENGYPCNANHPHLNSKKVMGESSCDKPLKTRLRSSTSVYFPVAISALLISPWSSNAMKIVESIYDDLVLMGDSIQAALLRRVRANVTLDQLLAAYELLKERKGSTLPRDEADIYVDEYKVLSQTNPVEEDKYSAFPADIPTGFKQYFKQITVIDKLTVTEALKGFTRLKPWGSDNGDPDTESRRLSPLSTYPKEWLPAVELKGEGLFFRFCEDPLKSWSARVGNRYDKMEQQLEQSYLSSRLDRFSPEYVLLHTFAHLFIRQVANECGYSASSIKEKIYSTFAMQNNGRKEMYGVLIYLASSDTDGSLGGLIGIAQNPNKLRNIFENMLHKAAWCSGDPLCVTSVEQGFDSLNYSACHNCVLLPETSCEFRNVLLDRVALIGTPEDPLLGLMGNHLTT